MEQTLLLSLATASIAFSVTETKGLAPLRQWASSHSRFLGKLLSCGYCLGHWVALGLVAIYRPRLLTTWWALDYLLAALIIAWLAAFQWALLCWLLEKARK